jgi:hypothetical protein
MEEEIERKLEALRIEAWERGMRFDEFVLAVIGGLVVLCGRNNLNALLAYQNSHGDANGKTARS